MSYSFTSRPTVSQAVRGGRGRGVAAGRSAASGRGTTDSVVAEGTCPTEGAAAIPTRRSTVPQEAVQRRDGFTMFAPDQMKRDEIAKKAKEEEDNFNKYKDSQKLGRVSYVGTAGGGLSQGRATQQRIQQNRNAATRKPDTFQQHRANEKEREQAEHNQRKAQARHQAERNKTKESDRQARLDEDRRQKNDAFLKRFEKGSK